MTTIDTSVSLTCWGFAVLFASSTDTFLSLCTDITESWGATPKRPHYLVGLIVPVPPRCMAGRSTMGAVNPAPEKIPRGRPRSTTSHQAVLKAVARLLEEQNHDYETLTIEGIAAEASVGKQTIYRWWSTKA